MVPLFPTQHQSECKGICSRHGVCVACTLQQNQSDPSCVLHLRSLVDSLGFRHVPVADWPGWPAKKGNGGRCCTHGTHGRKRASYGGKDSPTILGIQELQFMEWIFQQCVVAPPSQQCAHHFHLLNHSFFRRGASHCARP